MCSAAETRSVYTRMSAFTVSHTGETRRAGASICWAGGLERAGGLEQPQPLKPPVPLPSLCPLLRGRPARAPAEVRARAGLPRR